MADILYVWHLSAWRMWASWLRYGILLLKPLPKHNAFLHAFRRHVLRDKRHYYCFDAIEHLRQQLLRDSRAVPVTGWGAGSRHRRNYAPISFLTRHVSLPPRYGRLLFRLCLQVCPQNILELGTGLGLATLYLAASQKTARVITVEGNPHLAALARSHFALLGCSNVELMEMSFDHALSVLQTRACCFDMVVIDGDHRGKATLRYMTTLLPILAQKALVVLDDIRWSGDMAKAWHQLIMHPSVCLSIDLFRMGLLLLDHNPGPNHVAMWYGL
ncbi:MAG: class I SAM-dependent methyltransferase [Chitinophagales bacterium]|nr:class I SAM-dependent methyltransferase [Chitinophagales bacterium]MDW8428304.1 class I SAM-dependent methyltransferase [Chitinophagales bacterium]